MEQINYKLFDNNYIARRILELSTGKYGRDEICEIIGSERSLERVFLDEDVQAYTSRFVKEKLIYEADGKVCGKGEIYTMVKEHLAETKNRGITRILWDITRKCNLKCQHCYAFKEGDYSEELSLGQMYKTIDELKELQPYLIVYGGGEPFVRDDFFDIIKRTKEVLKCRIKVLTNGTFLTPEVIQKIKPYVDFIQISLDGTEQNHDYLRGHAGSFAKAVEAIKLVRKAGIEAGICMTINKYNLEDIDWVISFALEQGVYKLRISPFVASGKAVNNYKDWVIPPRQLKKLYARLAEYRLKYRTKILFDFRDELYGKAFLGCPGDKLDAHNQYLLCAAGRSLFYINAEGYITPCNFIDLEEYFVGNVKTDDIVSIWYSNPLFEQFRKLKVGEIEKCSVCKRKSICGAGLRCNALIANGNLKTIDPLCNFFEQDC
ncbi:MAG: radical SAM protein [Anaerocolumna sp.]